MNTLQSFFQWLLAASLRASLLAGAVLCLQVALRRWLPARWRHALWLPVVIVLIAPVLPESRFSVQNRLAPKPLPARQMEPQLTLEMPAVASLPAPAPTPPSRWDRHQLLFAAWLLGAGSVVSLGAFGYRRSLRGILRGAVKTDALLAKSIASVAAEIGLRSLPRVVQSAAVGSPAVAGLLRPMLLLPATFPAGFTASEARLVLLHELTHLKRRDLPLNWLLCALQALHWFNPLLWLAFAQMRADREAACDAQVLATDPEDHRAEYGHALLKLQTAPHHIGLSLAFIGIFQRTAALRSRIRAIATHRRAHPAWGIVAAGIVAALTMIGATRAETKPPAAALKAEKVGAIQMTSGELNITLKEMSFDSTRNEIKASGDVVVTTPELLLKSESVTIQQKSSRKLAPPASPSAVMERAAKILLAKIDFDEATVKETLI